MSTINISSDYNSSDIINIGIRGENEVTEVVFDYKAWHQEYGDGVVSLLVKRPADDAAYPVILSDDATHHAATWTIAASTRSTAALVRQSSSTPSATRLPRL